MGSGYKTTNGSVGRAHGYMTALFNLGCSVSRLLTLHNQGIAQWSLDPFPRERVGSGHETRCRPAKACKPFQKIFFTPVIYLLYIWWQQNEFTYILPPLRNTCGFREMLFIVTVNKFTTS